jgi:hypothetical protein
MRIMRKLKVHQADITPSFPAIDPRILTVSGPRGQYGLNDG